MSLSVSETVIEVPRATAAIAIDGRVDEAEWVRAGRDRLSDGSTIRLQHDGRHLYIAIEAVGSGFSSFCIASEKSVRILHASAALGAVTYTRDGTDWTSASKAFDYGMRNPALTDAARAERAAYLNEHGWVASTEPMTKGRSQELQIELSGLGREPRIALGFFVIGSGNTTSVATWPKSMPATDGCAAPRLVSGYVPTPLRFDADSYAVLRLR